MIDWVKQEIHSALNASTINATNRHVPSHTTVYFMLSDGTCPTWLLPGALEAESTVLRYWKLWCIQSVLLNSLVDRLQGVMVNAGHGWKKLTPNKAVSLLRKVLKSLDCIWFVSNWSNSQLRVSAANLLQWQSSFLIRLSGKIACRACTDSLKRYAVCQTVLRVLKRYQVNCWWTWHADWELN